MKALLGLLLTAPAWGQKADEHNECGEWALAGECRANPKMMLVGCQKSCASSMLESQHELCAEWAAQGECAANPGYMELSCAEPCGQSWRWSPYTKQRLGLPPPADAAASSAPHTSTPPTGNPALDGALAVGNRLRSLFEQGEDTFGLSADNQWGLSVSVGELLLYTANSAALAARSAHVDAGTGLMQRAALEIADEVSEALGAGPEIVHRNAFKLWKKLDETVIHKLLLVLVSHGPSGVTARHHLHGSNLEWHPQQRREQRALAAARTKNKLPHFALPDHLTEGGPASHEAFAALPRTQNGTATVLLPALGLGTCWLTPAQTYDAVTAALKAGVAHVDTAEAYQNEAEVGQAWHDSGLPREAVFLATKISRGESHGYAETKALVARQLKALQTDYIDLYYIHGYPQPPHDERFLGTWRALEEFVKAGTIEALGVSNYNRGQLERMFSGPEAQNFKKKPAVLQNKFDPYHQGDQLNSAGDDLVHVAATLGLAVVGYSTLSGWPLSGLKATEDRHVLAIAKNHERTPAQVLLRWALQSGVAVIPRSSSAQHVQENAAILDFHLSPDEMMSIDSLEHLIASPLSKPRRHHADHFGVSHLRSDSAAAAPELQPDGDGEL